MNITNLVDRGAGESGVPTGTATSALTAPGPAPTETCPHCKRALPCARFTSDPRAANGLRSWCRACHNTDARMRRARKTARRGRVLALTLGHKAGPSVRVAKALASGVLRKARMCQRCGTQDHRLVAHHEDYSRPLSVSWLCDKCHHWLHRQPCKALRDEWDMPLAEEPLVRDYRQLHHEPYAAEPVEGIIELRAALARLPYRERKVVELRYGIGGYTYTLKEVGRRLKVSRERVRQIEARAIRRLKAFASR